MDLTDLHDLAVHGASFANRLGGVILVGANDAAGLVTYPGIPRQYAARLKESFESAAKQWCEPVLDVRPVLVPLEGSAHVVLAANVTAHVAGVVGVNPRQGAENGARNQSAWLFPIRVGSHTKYISPSELPMLFDVPSRTAALRLIRIPANAQVQFHASPPPPTAVYRVDGFVTDPGGPLALIRYSATLKEVSLESNCAVFVVSETEGRGVGDRTAAVPLRDVTDVWHGTTGWCVRVRGRVVTTGVTADAYEPVVD